MKGKEKSAAPNMGQKRMAKDAQDEEEDGAAEGENSGSADKQLCQLCGISFAWVSFKNHQGRDHYHPCSLCDKQFVTEVRQVQKNILI